jgi:uncharacterized protein
MINLNSAALILAIILFIVGLLGTVLPMLPGPILVYGGMVIYGIMTDFESLPMSFFIVQTIILLIIFATDYISSAIGANLSGGSKQASIGAVVGTVIAIFFLGPLGLVIGPLLGATVVEILRGVNFKRAVRIGFGTLLGTLGGTLFKLLSELAMIGYFFLKVIL